MGAHLAGRPRERLLRPECVAHYTARMPTGTTQPTHPPEKSMSEAYARDFLPTHATESHPISALHRHTNGKHEAMV